MRPIVCVVRFLLIIELLGPSELAIRRRLTLEEEKEDLNPVATGSDDDDDDSTETKYLLDGLDLEVQQCGFSALLGLQN